jgi:hypothetical protein
LRENRSKSSPHLCTNSTVFHASSSQPR